VTVTWEVTVTWSSLLAGGTSNNNRRFTGETQVCSDVSLMRMELYGDAEY